MNIIRAVMERKTNNIRYSFKIWFEIEPPEEVPNKLYSDV